MGGVFVYEYDLNARNGLKIDSVDIDPDSAVTKGYFLRDL